MCCGFSRNRRLPMTGRLRRPGIRFLCDVVLFRRKSVCQIIREQCGLKTLAAVSSAD